MSEASQGPLLEVRGVSASYGAIQALSKVSLSVPQGAIVALLGSNGAGKSSTLNAISHLINPSAGEVYFAGEAIHRLPSDHIVGQGLVQVPEGREVFKEMSVRENLELGAFLRRDRGAMAEDLDRVFAMFPRLKERRRQTAGTLSGGEQQMLAMGRALMSRPRLLLLDEPSMGLAPLMVQKVFETIIAVAKEGVTMLLIEQNAKLALEVSDRGYVMESGEITLSGQASALLHDPKVRAAYLGEVA